MFIQPERISEEFIEAGEFQVSDDIADFRRSEGMATLFDYWVEKGGLTKTITRSHIHPGDIPRFIDRLVLLDVDHEQARDLAALDAGTTQAFDFTLTNRLMGTTVTEFYGERTGRDVAALDNNRAANRIYRVCERLLKGDQPLLSYSNAYQDDREYLAAYGLYLPLYDFSDTGAHFIPKILVYVEVFFMDQPQP